jgi:hypothetical protein
MCENLTDSRRLYRLRKRRHTGDIAEARANETPMPPTPNQDPDPSPSRPATLAYAFYAAAIWALVAYSLWGPQPNKAPPILAQAGRDCVR